MAALLLPLDGERALVTLDALIAFANQCEREQDPDTAKIADEIANTLRGLRGLDTAVPEQWLRHIGCGRASRRPQG